MFLYTLGTASPVFCKIPVVKLSKVNLSQTCLRNQINTYFLPNLVYIYILSPILLWYFVLL